MNKGEIISQNELLVLRCLESTTVTQKDCETAEIQEISFTTGIRDSDEILRALYTLEGKSLVQPFPRGDFTSNHWQITSNGMQALRLLQV